MNITKAKDVIYLLLSNAHHRGIITPEDYMNAMRFMDHATGEHKMMNLDKSYMSFKEALARRESGNNYQAKNTLGYLGKWQFGLARLTDFGLCQRKPNTKSWANSSFEWVEPFSEEKFMNIPKLQDAVFDIHVDSWRKWIMHNCLLDLDKEHHGTFLTLSGAIGCIHLLGPGGIKNFIKGEVGKDAYGTSAVDYIELFNGYEIPSAFDKVDLKELV